MEPASVLQERTQDLILLKYHSKHPQIKILIRKFWIINNLRKHKNIKNGPFVSVIGNWI